MNFSEDIIYSNDSLEVIENLPLYPAPDYELTVCLLIPNSQPKSFNAQADGTAHKLTLNFSDMAPGEYFYQAKVKKGTVIKTIEQGTINVLADISAGQDPRSYWKKIADNLKTAIEKLSSRDTSEVTILNRTYKYRDLNILIDQLKQAEIKAGIAKKPKRLLESY